MPITTLPDMTEFEGPKALKPDREPIPDADKTYAFRFGMANALLSRVIDGLTAIGLDDGTTAGSVRAAIARAIYPAANVETASIVSHSIGASARVVRSTYAVGNQSLYLGNLATHPIGKEIEIVKVNTGAFSIFVFPDGSDTVQGGAGGASFLLPGSGTAGSTTRTRRRWTVRRLDATSWEVTGHGLIESLDYAVNSIGGGVLQAGAVDSTQLAEGINTISGASATLGTAKINSVTYAAGTCALTLPASTTTWAVGLTRRVRKSNISTNPITIAPPAGGTVQGGAVDAVFTLPGSQRAASTSEGDLWWDVTRESSTAFRVVGGSVRWDSNGAVGLGGGALYGIGQLVASANGSAASPILRGTDADTGVYIDPTTNGVVTAVNGVDRIRARVDGTTEIRSGVGGGSAVLLLATVAGNVQIFAYNATPEGVITAGPGSKCYDFTNGREYIKNTGTGNTGWREMSPSSWGPWTGTPTGVSNVDSVGGIYGGVYVRVGDYVIGLFHFTVDPTASGTVTVRVPIPVASNFTNSFDAGGIEMSNFLAGGIVDADTTNDALTVTVGNTATTSYAVRVIAFYVVK